ncbi:anhydro-N-acetylmuramic acid kinase [Pedobacter westerhofensis]|uniref:Anhydro-N-acetylmuramic acid kinase n=1 Tax=Pedobacter westerhofensis TaxID=425512 RepID=A0A521FHL3_9SPHI|nr:anhydro-N-acetylmuramic acid kinase [Pedobacter westerhofensis]SMO95549.1 anhydro-N-acetylmuramic acid kinase [Pedobacter westerhofensis]
MNNQISKLADISGAAKRVIAGLMSGTSLDGLDIALCEFSGSGFGTRVKLLHFITFPYKEAYKEQLKSISFKKEVSLQEVTLLNAVIGTYSAELILEALKKWDFPVDAVDLIASHGQTIFHAPFSFHQKISYPDATLQIGDGDHIAVKTGIITLSDFRQKHIAAGGEGAPLAVYGDYLLFSSLDENRILLNIGGISNFTYLPAGRHADLVFSTDVGPGNTMMDQFIQLHYPGKYYDEDAAIAKTGKANEALVTALMANEFFDDPFPRTTGPELFNMAYLRAAQKASSQQALPPEDVLASLCEFTARSIIGAIRNSIQDQSFEVYLSGGGMHNPLLAEKLAGGLGLKLKDTADLGIDPDAKEAVLFALLANECVAGGDTDYGSRQGIPSVTMGKISLP